MQLESPSDEFPAPPALALTLPDGWEPFTSPAATVCASDPGSPPGFRSNVVVIVSKSVHDHSAAEVAAVLVEKTATDYPGATVLASDTSRVAGLEAVVSTVEFQPADAGFPICQVQGVVMSPTAHADVRYAVQFHGTCASDALAAYEPLFRDAFASLQLT